MIIQKEIDRSYRWTDATLTQTAAKIFASISRDTTEFETYGYDYVARTLFESSYQNFANRETDEKYEGLQMIATQEKQLAQNRLIAAILEVTRRANLAFAGSEGHLRQFGNSNISKVDDDELAKVGALVHSSAQRYFAQLSPRGLTAQHLAEVNDATKNYNEKLVEQFIAKTNRNAAVTARIEAGNKLYELLTEACNIGKSIWGPINEALYNDYVLYPASQSNTPDPSPDTSTTTTPPPTN